MAAEAAELPIWKEAVAAPPSAEHNRKLLLERLSSQSSASSRVRPWVEYVRQGEARLVAAALRAEVERAVAAGAEQDGGNANAPMLQTAENEGEYSAVGGRGRRRRGPHVLSNAAFEAWQFSASVTVQQSADGIFADPVLPLVEEPKSTLREGADAILVSELAKSGLSETQAIEMVQQLAQESDAAAGRVQEAAREPPSAGISEAFIRPSADNGDDKEVVLRCDRKAVFRIHSTHVAKLKELYHRWRGGAVSAAPNKDRVRERSQLPCRYFLSTAGCRRGDQCEFSHDQGGSVARAVPAAQQASVCRFFSSGYGCRMGDACKFRHVSGDESSERISLVFEDALFSLLARYEGLQGGGFQAALNEEAFDVLLDKFDVNFECFASPLNSRYGAYCSAFPDVDEPFGSCGSFFDFVPLGGGSYQANPPFVSDVIFRMAEYMEKWLCEIQDPLSFVVVVPAWTDTEAWQRLLNSPFLREHLQIHQKDHGYTEGKQWMRKTRWRIASFHTSVFFLQNEAGFSQWPPTEEACGLLRDAFVSKQVMKGPLYRGDGLDDEFDSHGKYAEESWLEEQTGKGSEVTQQEPVIPAESADGENPRKRKADSDSLTQERRAKIPKAERKSKRKARGEKSTKKSKEGKKSKKDKRRSKKGKEDKRKKKSKK